MPELYELNYSPARSTFKRSNVQQGPLHVQTFQRATCQRETVRHGDDYPV